MEWMDIAYRIFSAIQDVVVIVLGVLAWMINRKMGKTTKKILTESNKVDAAENNQFAEVSAKESSMVTKTIETPVTTVHRELQVTLSESEVESLRQVIAASGRSSEVKDVYDAITSFQTLKK